MVLRKSEQSCYNICSAVIAQSVERIHGKDEVPGSNPGHGSMKIETC